MRRWFEFRGESSAAHCHLEKEKKGELRDVVLIRLAVVAQDVEVVPEFANDAVACYKRFSCSRFLSAPASFFRAVF